MTTTAENLAAALDRLSCTGWIKGAYHHICVDAAGLVVNNGLCAVGAVCEGDRSFRSDPIASFLLKHAEVDMIVDYCKKWVDVVATQHVPELDALAGAIRIRYPNFRMPASASTRDLVEAFNDHPTTTWHDIRTVFTTAITTFSAQALERP